MNTQNQQPKEFDVNSYRKNHLYFTQKVLEKDDSGNITKQEITGMMKDITVGDYIRMSDHQRFIVNEILEQGDCKGVFNNPELAKNSYFKAIITRS